MKFEKGQWVTCEGFYMQVMNRVSDHVYECRFAGRKGEWVDKHIGKIIPATLTPDFSNAKEGDECFSAGFGVSVIKYVNPYAIHIARKPNIFIDKGHKRIVIIAKLDGKVYADDVHPTLFNSFAQFLAYWQEDALKLKGGSNA